MSKNKRLTKTTERCGVDLDLCLDTDTCFIDAVSSQRSDLTAEAAEDFRRAPQRKSKPYIPVR